MKVGIDILDIERVKNLKNLEKIFTVDELAYFDRYNNQEEHIAGTFCAKEAIFKCLNLPILVHKEIEILHDENNRPYANFYGKTKEYFEQHFKEIEISISHTKKIATAIAIAF
ncbi:MAG: holo-ACP synthase [Clostridia bacterium]|nr:holo-ACP synthase [Clostridia bacterium]